MKKSEIISFYFNVLLLMGTILSSAQLLSLEYGLFAKLEYGLFAKNENQKPISKIFVIGERCSGTNFLNSLIRANSQFIDNEARTNGSNFLRLPNCQTTQRIGQKHFPPWYQLGKEMYLGNPRYYHFQNTEDYLFVIIFRNPYNWARSFFLQPFHLADSLHRISFSQFIRRECLSNNDQCVIAMRRIHPSFDLDPENGRPFINVLALRNAKIRNMLEIKNRASNVYYINYETVCHHPQEVLGEIANLYGLQLNSQYSSVDDYKGYRNQQFKPKIYSPITQVDLDYINFQLDKELEEKIGYELIYDANELFE